MDIECLVISGGGHLGFIQLGTFYFLEKEKINFRFLNFWLLESHQKKGLFLSHRHS